MVHKSTVIVGGGGRESALKYVLEAEGHKADVISDGQSALDFIKDDTPDLVIFGSEVALVEGYADAIRAKGIAVCGPSKQAAQLEGSKAFAEAFMDRHGITRPASTVVTPDSIDSYALPAASTIVLKADGLAGGKGVVLPESDEEAAATLKEMFSGVRNAGAGKDCVVVQERLSGPEVSVFALTDGSDFVILPYTQDHKRLKDGDKGPNTGGMGAYAPADILVNTEQREKIEAIIEATISGMRAEGMEYRGVLYVGIMLARERDDEPVVIEYNVRFGDPEAQVLLPMMHRAGVGIYELLASTDSTIEPSGVAKMTELKTSALTACLASKGYPESSEKGVVIHGIDAAYPNTDVFFGAVMEEDGVYTTNGGRVLYVTGYGETIDSAAQHAYAAIGDEAIHFDGMQYRTDIAWQIRS